MIVWRWSFTICIVGIGIWRERVIEAEEGCGFGVPWTLDHRELGVRGKLGVGKVGGGDDGSGVVLEGAVDPGRADGHDDYWVDGGHMDVADSEGGFKA